jgi:hypothetical protein
MAPTNAGGCDCLPRHPFPPLGSAKAAIACGFRLSCARPSTGNSSPLFDLCGHDGRPPIPARRAGDRGKLPRDSRDGREPDAAQNRDRQRKTHRPVDMRRACPIWPYPPVDGWLGSRGSGRNEFQVPSGPLGFWLAASRCSMTPLLCYGNTISPEAVTSAACKRPAGRSFMSCFWCSDRPDAELARRHLSPSEKTRQPRKIILGGER